MFFTFLTLFTSLLLASISGWFSVTGITIIYSGTLIHSLLMGVVIELGKLVTISWLYRNWKFSKWKFKTIGVFITILMMLATNISVYGFLMKSHLSQGAGTLNNDAKVERLDQQIAREKSAIIDNEKVITQLDSAINSYLIKDKTDKSIAIRRSQAPQRKKLREDIDVAQKRIDQYSDEKLALQSEVRKLQLDVGPIRNISELIYGTDGNTDKNIEAAVRMFTLIIVLSLDPLAVWLLIAANNSIMRLQNKKEEDGPDTLNISLPISDNTILPAEDPVIEKTIPEDLEPKIAEQELSLLDIEKIEEDIPVTEEDNTKLFKNSSEVTWPTIPKEELVEEVTTEEPIHAILPIENTPTLPETPVAKVPWAADAATLKTILGSNAHFVAEKLESKEILPDLISIVDDNQENTELLQKKHKYPIGLSWLTEFKKG